MQQGFNQYIFKRKYFTVLIFENKKIIKFSFIILFIFTSINNWYCFKSNSTETDTILSKKAYLHIESCWSTCNFHFQRSPEEKGRKR